MADQIAHTRIFANLFRSPIIAARCHHTTKARKSSSMKFGIRVREMQVGVLVIGLYFLFLSFGRTWAFKPTSNMYSYDHRLHHSILARPCQPNFSKLTSPVYRKGQLQPFTTLKSSSPNSPSGADDLYFDAKTTAALVGGQSILVLVAAALATALGVPNKGLGPDVAFSAEAWKAGFLYTLPLVGLAAALDVVEDNFPALQDVTKATHRSVLSLLGSTFKPVLGLVTSTILGLAAGFGEEMLFRGILQYELVNWSGSATLSIGASSLVFGALHAVTPMYAFLATLASIYFGALYVTTGNLAVPILCHALYDVGAFLWAHWSVSRLEPLQQEEISKWQGPAQDR